MLTLRARTIASPHPTPSATVRRIAVAAATLALLWLVAATPRASAAQPASGDLNPPPPASYTCKAVGDGTICRAHTVDVYSDVPLGVVCGAGAAAVELLDNGTREVNATRWYDRDGNLVRRLRTFLLRDAFLANPATGRTIGYSQHNTDNEILGIPGDLDSITWTGHGHLTISVPGSGALVEAGRTIVGPGGDIEAQAGPTELSDYFAGDASVVAPLCAYLGTP